MSGNGHPNPAAIRSRLTHPVVDADGHWLEFGPVLAEQDGLITADDFRDFTFANAVRLWGTVNPAFFKGTVVEKPAADVLTTA
jgi:hypothetical protein